MSHFVVLVVVPKDHEDTVERLLAPYDENTEVEEHEESCYCINLKAITDAKTEAEKIFGNIYNIERSVYDRDDIKGLLKRRSELFEHKLEEPLSEDEKLLLNNLDSIIKQEIKIAGQPYEDYKNKILNEHPLKDKPNHDCNSCKGTGVVMTTSNPNSKWDWCEEGGRWYDFLNLGSNVAPVPEIIKALKDLNAGVFAIVTPDGKWHEKGEMGWWATTSNENENWDVDMFNILEDYNSDEYVGVTIDCHV